MLAKTYLQDAKGVIICYDMTDTKSFESLDDWLGVVHESCQDDVKVIVAGCKADLQNEVKVKQEAVEDHFNSLGVQHIATSAKNGTNVEKVFQAIYD